MSKKKTRKRSFRIFNIIQGKSKALPKYDDHANITSKQYTLGILDADTEKLIELANEIWRLHKHITKAISLDQHRSIRSSLNRLSSHLEYYKLEVFDYTGEKYNENMNIQVLSFEESLDVKTPTIIETVRPSIIMKGNLMSHASVIVGIPTSNNLNNCNEEKDDNNE